MERAVRVMPQCSISTAMLCNATARLPAAGGSWPPHSSSSTRSHSSSVGLRAVETRD